jgi:hypothetical protein
MKLEVVWRCDDEPQHARIENADLDTDYDGTGWSDAYVAIGGYFGSHGPHVFAAAPELYRALEMAAMWLDIDGRFDMQGINAALAKARGEQ